MMISLVISLVVIGFWTYTAISLITKEDDSAQFVAITLFAAAAITALSTGEQSLQKLSCSEIIYIRNINLTLQLRIIS